MGRRKGPSLTTKKVVHAAIEVLAAEGADALGITRVAAELGIKPASMYNHVASGDALARAVLVEGNSMVLEVLKDAVRGVVDPHAQLSAIARALRVWALEHRGLYTHMSRVKPDNDAPEFARIAQELLDLFMRPLGQLGVAPDAQVHAIRGLRAATHGFITLETQAQFQMRDDVDESFTLLIDTLIRGLQH